MVAVDDWISAVTPSPRKKAFRGLLVTLSITRFRAPEEPSLRPSPIRRMPYRNMASPPSRVRMSNTFISIPVRFAKNREVTHLLPR